MDTISDINKLLYNSNESLNGGLVVVIDGQKCSWRMARLVIRHVTAIIGENLSNVIVVRPDAFWDKQHVVENCAKSQKKGEVFYLRK